MRLFRLVVVDDFYIFLSDLDGKFFDICFFNIFKSLNH